MTVPGHPIMIDMDRRSALRRSLLAAITILAGCGSSTDTTQGPATGADQNAATPAAASDDTPTAGVAEPTPDFTPVVLRGQSSPTAESAPIKDASNGVEQRQQLLAAMMPLQNMLGRWRGITQRQFGDFKGVDEPSWVWDFQTDRNQPALVMASEDGPYFRKLRLTYLTDRDTFQMTSQGPEEESRTFEGTFSEQPEQVRGDDNRTHVTYKLTLTQVDSDESNDQWQVVFNQQETNRYLLELYRKRGSSFQRMDTVSTQREGTSIAASDEDYGDRKCIISGGLGTIQVSYKGRTFWVCCTGCKAAFEEDPESWIAEHDAAVK
jgi:hypothetical protein